MGINRGLRGGIQREKLAVWDMGAGWHLGRTEVDALEAGVLGACGSWTTTSTAVANGHGKPDATGWPHAICTYIICIKEIEFELEPRKATRHEQAQYLKHD